MYIISTCNKTASNLLFFRTTESRYIDACETVKTRAILSLGVACFHWKPPPNNNSSHVSDDPPPAVPPTDHTSDDGHSIELGASVFNVWLMCQSPYTIDPSSALFLLEHGFDFNKQIARGIPYTPGPMEVSRAAHQPICSSVEYALLTCMFAYTTLWSLHTNM